ncbi:MAG: DNA polymerase III subunit gamma/tau [Clostridia bacterium]|nr:DNA polymerase III subunit gamma/tau [Clostridia bacterium]
MSYKALYREFRPIQFKDLVGQEHISTILKNQIMNDRIGHAYLFSGIRGTGKTTIAKIFARAVNCLNPHAGEPCNECEVCKAILNENLTDVVEIDAASNNGVDNIRDITEEVMYFPTKAKYKVYIIDEVHMLSTGAFNALLKTLEEPPQHVKFILATTEPNKLPATILSRCQRFDFRRINNADIIKRLKEILNAINKKADDNALKMIAEASEGAMRDAISILDRCVSDSDNITVDYVSNLIGLPNGLEILDLIECINNKEVEKVLSVTDNLLDNGKNINIILSEMIKHFQNILMFKTTGKIDVYSEKEIEKVKKIADNISNDKIINNIVSISEIQNIIKWSSSQNIIAKSQLIKLTQESKDNILEDLLKRIENLEQGNTQKKTEEIMEIVKDKNEFQKEEIIENAKEVIVEKKNTEVEQKEEKVVAKEKIESTNIQEIQFDEREWKDILVSLREAGKFKLYTNLINVKVGLIEDNVIGIYFAIEFNKIMVEQKENIQILKEFVTKQLGKEYSIRCFYEAHKIKSKMSGVEDTAKQFNIPIDIVDE